MSAYDDRDPAIAREPLPGRAQYDQAQYDQAQYDHAQYEQGPYEQGPYHQTQQLPPQQYYRQQPYRAGFGGGMGFGRTRGWSETKPFFMTSEFIGTLICVIGIAITAGVTADLDSQGAGALIAGLVAAYTVSRGIAKAGTRSRATDPRDDMSFSRSHEGHSHAHS
jgi:hypothetical protein